MRDPGLLAIACPGPSFKPENIPDGYEVAAVNHVLKDLPYCRWWVAYDCPNDVHEQAIERFLELKPTIVTMKERRDCWAAWFRSKLKLKEHQFPSFEFCDWGPIWYKVAIKRGPRYSSLLAISWALRRRFREMRFLGCDMGGAAYYDDATTTLARNARRKPVLWEQRWKKEREMFHKAQKVAFDHGHMRITGLPWDDPPELPTPRRHPGLAAGELVAGGQPGPVS